MRCAAALAFVLIWGCGAPAAHPEIRAVLEQQVEAWNHGDLEGFMEHYWKSDALTFVSVSQRDEATARPAQATPRQTQMTPRPAQAEHPPMEAASRGSETASRAAEAATTRRSETETHTTRGWQATLERYRQRYPTRESMGTLRFDLGDIARTGEDSAEVAGRFRLKRADGSESSGRFYLHLRRIDGAWVIARDFTVGD